MKKVMTREEFGELIKEGCKVFGGLDLSLLQAEDFRDVNIEEFNLYNCNLMNFTPKEVHNSSLYEVNLRENNLSYLQENAFSGVNVRYANLSNCNIKNFDPQLVDGRSICGADLSGNDLSHLKEEKFKDVDVTQADLSNCNVENFNPQLVKNKDIWRLNLSENDLSYLGINAFEGVQVDDANLRNCKLKNFDPQQVKDKNLYGIILSGNDLSYLKPNAFSGISVNEADLSNCNLKDFNPQQVYDKNLNRTNLSGNDLSYLTSDSFYDVRINYANFENTSAYIDLMKIPKDTRIGNFKGCFLTNFEEALCYRTVYRYSLVNFSSDVNQITYSEDSFDDQFIAKHKEYFLDKSAPVELKRKFYSRNLDLETFNKYQEFLKDKNYKLFFRLEYAKLCEFFNVEEIPKIVENDPYKVEDLLNVNKVEEMYLWYKNHKFIPNQIIVETFPKDQIHKFNCKRWSALMKNGRFYYSDAELGLLKAAMVMGVFEKEEQGYSKLLQMISENCKLITPSNVHKIFDSMSMTYDKDFKKLFIDNLEMVLKDSKFSEKISSIQRNFEDIKAEYKGKKITLKMCESYLENLSYDNVKDGCHELSIYAKNNGYNQNDFEKLQETFLRGKQRESSNIPQIEIKTEKLKGRILRLDDSLALVLGNLTECCQRLQGAAESSMLHSVLEKNGRVFIVEDEDERVVAQSWVWRNGNVLCFDNIEVPTRALGYANQILEVYKEAANEFIKKDADTFKTLVKEGKVSEEKAEQFKLAKITVGKGYTDVGLEKLEKDNERIMPEEYKKIYNYKELYIKDSDEQHVLYKSPDYKKIEMQFKIDSLNLYKDERDIVKEAKGEKIHKDIVKLIKNIESQAFPQEMQLLQEIQTYKDIAKAYAYNKDNMRVVYNKDWYMIYEEKDKDAHIGDIAKVKAATRQEDVMAVKEREKEFYNLLNKYKNINMEARDKTSYVLMKRLQRAGKIDILVEEALGDFRDGGEKMHKLVVSKKDKNAGIVELGR